MISKEKQAAQMLLGKELPNGWLVVEKIEKESDKSAKVYSSYYKVQKGEQKGFLKAFDYSAATKSTNDYTEDLKAILDAFTLEKEILKSCTEYGCKNVIQLLEDGSIDVEEAEKYPRVEYLILEYAEKGSVKDVLKNEKITLEWKLLSLHQLAKGLNELHKIKVAHQDIKPSNLVNFESGKSKISDLGSAMRLGSTKEELPLHLFDKDYAGTWAYAPPELLYGEKSDDDVIRRIGCDLYLLGSMVAFYFTHVSMTSLIKDNLADHLCWTNNSNYGNYNSVKSYVIQAFEMALIDMGREIENQSLRQKVTEIVRYLCNPDPLKRGHERSIKLLGSNYSLERFVTVFDLLASRVRLNRL